MNHSVLVNFLDLLDILIHCPDSGKRQEKIDDISLLFIHMHHLINEFRPHQVINLLTKNRIKFIDWRFVLQNKYYLSRHARHFE